MWVSLIPYVLTALLRIPSAKEGYVIGSTVSLLAAQLKR